VHNTGINALMADIYVDQLCRREKLMLCPQLIHDTPKTDILNNILSIGSADNESRFSQHPHDCPL